MPFVSGLISNAITMLADISSLNAWSKKDSVGHFIINLMRSRSATLLALLTAAVI